MEITKGLFEDVEWAEKEIGKIVLNLFVYNPDIKSLCEKVPLENIQHDIACLGRHLSILYADIGEIIRNENDKR